MANYLKNQKSFLNSCVSMIIYSAGILKGNKNGVQEMESDVNKKEELNKIIQLVNNSEISSIKQTVTQIINTINDPDSSAKDLKSIIDVDPPLTAKLLKLANSALYGYAKTICEIQEAIVCIGFDAVRELALSQKVCELFQDDNVIQGYSRTFLWKHCVAVALCSKLIYRRAFRRRGDNIYVAGLLHDIGLIVLDQFYHDEFVEVLNKSIIDRTNVIYMEDINLGFNHMDIAGVLAEDWGFPDEITSVLGKHHTPDNSDPKYELMTMTLYVADSLVQEKLLGFCDTPFRNNSLFRKCLMKLKIREKGTDLIIKEVEQEIAKMEKAGWF